MSAYVHQGSSMFTYKCSIVHEYLLCPLPLLPPSSPSQVASLKSLKRELESKVTELEDELDEANMRMESLEQVSVDAQ